jgi:hypothetical protein
MNSRFERIAIEVLAAFIVVSAVAGGGGLIAGRLPFPLDWLAGTPFSTYLVPGVILAVIVGGSALGAAALMVQRHPFGVPAALGAGFIQVGWILGELVLVGTRDNVMGWLQVIYFVAGAIVATLAAHLWLQSGRAAMRATCRAYALGQMRAQLLSTEGFASVDMHSCEEVSQCGLFVIGCSNTPLSGTPSLH